MIFDILFFGILFACEDFLMHAPQYLLSKTSITKIDIRCGIYQVHSMVSFSGC